MISPKAMLGLRRARTRSVALVTVAPDSVALVVAALVISVGCLDQMLRSFS